MESFGGDFKRTLTQLKCTNTKSREGESRRRFEGGQPRSWSDHEGLTEKRSTSYSTREFKLYVQFSTQEVTSRQGKAG